MTPSRAFVTGGAGFVGRHLLEALLSAGWSVTALVRRPEQAESLRKLGAGVVIGDLNDRCEQIAGLEPNSVVFHLAAAMTTLAAGVDAGRSTTANLIDAMVRSSARRLILVSSAAVHGPHPGSQLVDETTPRGPHQPWNFYVHQKVAAEAAVLLAQSLGKLSATIVRPTRVIGPGDANLVPWVTRLGTSLAGALAGDDGCRHPVVVVSDLAQGLVACANAAATEGRTYYLSSARQITKRELIDVFVRAGMPAPQRSAIKSLALAIGRVGLASANAPWQLVAIRSVGPRAATVAVLEARAGRPVDHDCAVSCSRATADFGWSGSADLEQTIVESVRWHNSRGARSFQATPVSSVH